MTKRKTYRPILMFALTLYPGDWFLAPYYSVIYDEEHDNRHEETNIGWLFLHITFLSRHRVRDSEFNPI